MLRTVQILALRAVTTVKHDARVKHNGQWVVFRPGNWPRRMDFIESEGKAGAHACDCPAGRLLSHEPPAVPVAAIAKSPFAKAGRMTVDDGGRPKVNLWPEDLR